MTSTPIIARALFVALPALGCFSPAYPDCLVACADGGACPAGFTCDHGFCRTPSAGGCMPDSGLTSDGENGDSSPDEAENDGGPPDGDGGDAPDPMPRLPTIGWFSRDCSATLIASNVAVTAAHCVGFTPLPMPDDIFVITDADGDQHTFVVDRIKLLGAGRRTDIMLEPVSPTNQPVPDGTGVNDVALLHLATAVFPQIASPTPIADAPPEARIAEVTLYGLGCASPSPQVGGGSLDRFTYVVGQEPGADLCPHDSGGPIVLETGEIWALNLGLHAASPGIAASVTYFKTAIMHVLRDWVDGSRLEAQFDRPGPIIADFLMNPPERSDCADACVANPECRAFTSRATHCLLKGGFLGWVPDPDATSGLRPLLETGIRRSGAPYRDFNVPLGRVDLCWAECAADGACASWTAGAFTSVLRCSLMQVQPEPAEDVAYTSGIKADLSPGVLRGRPLQEFDVIDADACRRSCAAEVRCRGFTVGSVPLHCSQMLTVRSLETASDPSLVSAVRGGLEWDTNRIGGAVIREYPMLGAFVAEACQADCAIDSRCRAWTYSAAGVFSSMPYCWLKSDVPAAERWEGYISGVKGAEFTGL
jgi:PAN domain-containing protein/trypsin